MAAVAPEILIRRHVAAGDGVAVLRGADGSASRRLPLPVTVAGAGKAAARMALGCEVVLGAEAVSGLVITADGCEERLASVTCLAAGHPLPDERGLAASRRLLEIVRAARGAVLFLLSGGASSLLVLPRPPLGLDDEIEVARLLLESGADITEFNCVRKHLSLVKGGGLLRAAPAAVHTLVLSDVVGDDLAVIGSGPTVADPTTFADALAVLRRYDLLDAAPPRVLRLLEAGARGEVEETLAPEDPEAARGTAQIVGSNAIALEAAATAGRGQDLRVRRLTPPLTGDVRVAARRLAAEIRREVAAACSSGRRHLLLSGGETTVRVTGGGRGGRNQELALALAEEIRDLPVAVLCAGSDGVDGPTDAAGAFADGTTAARAASLGLDIGSYLAANDSYSFFDRLGDLFRPGPTGTNVADLQLAAVG